MKTEKPLLPQSYTIQQIDQMAKSWDSGAFAMAGDARVRQFDKAQKLTFIEIGYWCLLMEQKESWRVMYGGGKFKSFGQWITDAAPSSRATCYAALGEVKKALEDGMELDQMNRIPRCNVKTVNRLSTKLKKDPEILKAAETMEERAFLRKIEKEHPDQHVEDKNPYRFSPDKTQRTIIDRAIEGAMLLYSLTSREAALEVIANDWWEDRRDELTKTLGHVS